MLASAVLACLIIGAIAAVHRYGFAPWRTTPYRTPADVSHIRLQREDSGRMKVYRVWLERKEDGLFVAGYVMPQQDVDTTSSQLTPPNGVDTPTRGSGVQNGSASSNTSSV
jgi:hypothetical protein